MNENECCASVKAVSFITQLESGLSNYRERLVKIASHNNDILASFRGEDKSPIKEEKKSCHSGKRGSILDTLSDIDDLLKSIERNSQEFAEIL